MPRKNFPYRKEQRRESAQERQAERDKRSSEEQIALLDKKFGEGLGAVKERRRLTVVPDEVNGKGKKRSKKRGSRVKKSTS